ncbi:MAG: TlpA family protein disulfide reductase [Chloroflexi bacterium]|nr:TlpA family protein disulfide reductase [Chloroflexota bacterium]
MTSQRIGPVLILVVAVLGVVWIAVSRVPDAGAAAGNDPRESPRAGFLAPRLHTTLLSGEVFDLQALRGQVVVLNFWATWCAPCRAEMPAMQSVYERRKGDGLALVGVNQMEDPGTIAPFLAQYQLTFPVALDPTGDWSQRYRVLGLPTTYFINRQGVIRDVVFGGPMDPALLASKIDALLRE